MPARPSELLGRMYRRLHDHSLGNAVDIAHGCVMIVCMAVLGVAVGRPCVRVATLLSRVSCALNSHFTPPTRHVKRSSHPRAAVWLSRRHGSSPFQRFLTVGLSRAGLRFGTATF